MNRRDRFVLAGALVFIIAAAALWLMPSGLSRAPETTFQTIEDEQVTMSELRGQPLLVTFWATTCTSCIREIPHLVELHERYHSRGLSIIAVAMSYDPPDQVIEFNRIHDLPYRIALDSDGEVAAAFNDVMLTPTTFLIAPDGRIAIHRIGLFDTDVMKTRIESMLGEPGAG